MRILHVLSSNFFAGSVSYAISLSEKQVSEGHSVYIITDKLSDKFPCIQFPISNRSLLQRFRNINFLQKFIRDNQINIVHAHSRAASWVSYFAVQGTNISLVSTIHGCQVKHSSLKKNDVFGERIIGICPNLMFRLKNEMLLSSDKLVHIPNGFNFDSFQKFNRERPLQDGKVVISVMGRYNGPKGENIAHLVMSVFPELLKEFPEVHIQLVGGEWESFPLKGINAYNELRALYNERIQYLGFSDKINQLIVDSDLIISAGRIAVEGLFYGIPVFAIGEACCYGILKPSNIDDAIASNFGDVLSVNSSFQPNTEEILKELQSFMENQQNFKFDFSGNIAGYDYKHVYPKIMHVYSSAIMQKAHRGHIPVLMYHKVTDAPIDSRHRIFVTKDKFKKHLKFFKYRGLTSITFKDYLAFANGERPISEFPKKPFILTFDDGYENNYTNMLPLTQKYGFKGVLFLLGDFSVTNNNWDIGETPVVNRLMSTKQKKEFVDSGWEIGAHTLSHCDLTNIPEEQARYEIEMSKISLEENLQTNIISFAYPYGKYNDSTITMVKKSGFEFAVATDTGGMLIDDDRFAIFRVNMFPEENLFQLIKKTSARYRVYYRLKRKK